METKRTTTQLERPSDPETRRSILDAVSSFDVTTSSAWDDLDQLSNRTMFEGLEANPDGVFIESPGSFRAVANVYVTLNYGDNRDSTSMSDSYPVEVQGKIDPQSHEVSIDDLKIDTSSFYE